MTQSITQSSSPPSKSIRMKIIKLINCRIVYDTYMSQGNDQLWFTEYSDSDTHTDTNTGIIVDQQELFYSRSYHQNNSILYEIIDCQNHIVTPGFIDLQLNGGWGFDFSSIDH